MVSNFHWFPADTVISSCFDRIFVRTTQFHQHNQIFKSQFVQIECVWSVLSLIIWNNLREMQVSYSLMLTQWGRVTHTCANKVTSIGSDNGPSPGRRQAIFWTNGGILLIGPLGTNFNEILIKIQTFLSRKTHLKMSSGKWRPFCLGLNVLSCQIHSRIKCLWIPGTT